MDRRTMRSLLENMERAAEQILQQDAAFYEVLEALKWEIDRDPRVQAAIRDLRAGGRSVTSSFVPQIRIRIKTEEGTFSLPRQEAFPDADAEQTAGLTEELRNAAKAAMTNSRSRHELDAIVHEAVTANDSFERIVSAVESAGHQLLICVDLTTYAQVREQAMPLLESGDGDTEIDQGTVNSALSGQDLKFLKSVGIKA
jgi:hypothetical protein